MSAFTDSFNSRLSRIKLLVNKLYSDTKEQYMKQLSKSFASYIELKNVYPKRAAYADDFQDMSRVQVQDNILCDRDGMVLQYTAQNVKFSPTLYTMDTYAMTMNEGQIIPGSRFYDIFEENIGFWGYTAKNISDVSFTIPFSAPSEINKIYLNTNNPLTVALYIKEDYDRDWVQMGERNGTKHVWNFENRNVAEIKFSSKTDLFSVSHVQAGLVKYQRQGTFESEYYSITDLNTIKFTADTDVPPNTSLDFFIGIEDQVDEYPLSDETEISGGIVWVEGSGIAPSFTLPSGCITDSLEVRSGYGEWDIVDTNDSSWSVVPISEVSISSSGIISVPAEYELINGSLERVTLGESVFHENTDYSVIYDLTGNTMEFIRLPNGAIPESSISNLQFTILAQKPEPVKQIRAYVDIQSDEEIVVQGFTLPFTLRHVVIRNGIYYDTTQEVTSANASYILQNVNGVTSYVLNGLSGTNLIEITYLTGGNVAYLPQVISTRVISHPMFGKRYRLMETVTSPQEYEYTIQSNVSPSGILESYTLTPGTPENTTWYRYGVSLDTPTSIKLIARFTSMEGKNTATLRSYDIQNIF